MSDTGAPSDMPASVAAIRECGYAIWADQGVAADFRKKFDGRRIPVSDIRSVRIWGLQVDDERELPGHERTQIPNEQLWEVNLVALDGSRYEVEAGLLVAAPE
ncbi:MAG TPA: hypothetical protein VF851_00345 [Steroidobacteraceae bacterium]